VVQPADKFEAQESIESLFELGEKESLISNVRVDCDKNLRPLRCNRDMLVQLLAILLRRLQPAGEAASDIAVTASEAPNVWGTPGVSIGISGTGPGWDADKLAGIFTPFFQVDGNPQDLGLDLLSAFFIAYHHGGDLAIQKTPQPPGFILQLPYEPSLATRPTLETNCLEKVFTRFNSEEMF
jgi:signal transduction histidine kinase